MSQGRRSLRPLPAESTAQDPNDDGSSRKITHRSLTSFHHHLSPRSAPALTANPTDKDSLGQTLARAMNTLDHNRDGHWYAMCDGTVPKCPQNTDPQTSGRLPTAKTKLFFNHVQTPSSSSSSPSPPASSTRRFYPVPPISTHTSSYFSYLDHPSAMTGPIRTKDAVDSRSPSASGSNTAATTMGHPSTSAKPYKGKNPPRPLNAWIIYRREKLQEILKDPENKRLPQSELSKKISALWKAETDDSRARFEYEANLSKAQHQKDYPDYQFRPMKRADKQKERIEKKKEADRERAERKMAKIGKRASSTNASTAATPLEGGQQFEGPSSSHLPSAPSTSSAQHQQVHSFMVQRYGVCGPSPPLSQAPSPYGSPEIEGFSLDEPEEVALHESTGYDASRVASGSTAEAGTSRHPSASHEHSIPVAQPRPSVPIRPPTTTGWNGGAPQQGMEVTTNASTQHAAGGSVLVAQAGQTFVNDSQPQNAIYNPLGVQRRDVLQQWISDANPAVHGGYEYSEVPEEDASAYAYVENASIPNIFTLQMDSAALNEMPPGEIRVSPSNPYASVPSNQQPPLPSRASDNVFDLDLNQIATVDLQAFSNFFANYTAQEGLLKDDLLGREGGVEVTGVANDVSANLGFDDGFNFQLGFDPNVPIPGLSNDEFLGGPAPEMPHSQFFSDVQYDFGDGSGLVNNLFGQHDVQADLSNLVNEAPDPNRGAIMPQAQILPTPPDTESSPRSAGSTDARGNQASPVDARPRSYMPPPGAMNTTMRRAAGTWRPPANLTNDEE
ncbi:hypothetical protein SCHPADRAFT_884447 [Schizopora paradoxa]|uniref:HMG box domain-containing protein n=1 Tax=Schizopora paradoxa TaxID=27342 RepID=A0A0H2SF43_9AGAM|nr:hypothetical protein SCHPADRAFT_884447 [Schizopora paradoxa]